MRPFDRPDLDQRRGKLALYVTGGFRIAKPGQAYEGRLQVHNPVGGLSVEQVDGDKLPNGHSLYIDQATKQVVLAWPAYSEAVAVVLNPNFEAGDNGWEKGAGWSIGTENPPTGLYAGRYGETAGSSLIENTSRFPINPGRIITATCTVRQGASSEGNAGAAVQLQWRNLAGALVGTSEGNPVMSASKNRVYPSTVKASPPPGAELVNMACRGIRNRENKPLWIDDFVWDHQQLTGINTDGTFALTLRIRDSAGRSVLWKGSVVVVASVLFAATGVGTGMIRRSTNGTTWNLINTGLDVEVFRVDVCANRVYASGLRKAAVSFDGGETFVPTTGLSLTDNIVGIAADETTGYVVLITDNNHILRSENGIDFVPASYWSGTKGSIVGIAGRILVGATNNTLKVTTNGGVSWTAQENNLPLSNGSYTSVSCIEPYALGFLAAGSSDKHIFRSTTGNPTAWSLGANINRNGGGTVSLGVIGLQVMICYSNAYRFSQDGGLTIGPEVPMENSLTVGLPQGRNRIFGREGMYYSSADTGVMRYEPGTGWRLVLNERSSTGRRPCVALLT